MNALKVFRSAAPAISAFVLSALAAVAPAQENVWTSHGPTDVGWVNDLSIADSVAYAATLNGIFRSNDRAASWRQSGLAGESIIQIVSAPGAAVVLARGSGSVPGGGTLYASRDAGQSWAPVPGLPPVTQAAIDPRQPSTAYVGAENAIWKSTDAGSSWQLLSATPGSGPRVFAFDSRSIYVVTFDTVDNLYKLYKSLDGGVSWATVSAPIPSPTTIAGGAASGIVYTGGVGSFCRSSDSAATWTCSPFPQFPIRIVEVPGAGPDATPRILAASYSGLYISSDGGATWAPADGELGSAYDALALASDASGSLVLAGTETQVFRSQNRGDSWTPASAGLHSSQIAALVVDPQDPSRVWAAAAGFAASPKSGLFRSADAGLSWSLRNGPASSPYIRFLAIGPGHPSTLYAGGPGVYRSEDDGEHWTSSTLPGGAPVQALAVDPGSPERVWAAPYYGGLFRSDDGARTWTSLPAIAQEIYCILFDGKQPGTLYAGSYFDVYFDYPEPIGGSILVSRDSGANWTKSQNVFGSPVVAIASDPFHDGGLYVGTSRGVFHSVDDGLTWLGPGVGLPTSTYPTSVITLVADPVRPGRLYAATDGRVYRTIDGAQTWHEFSSGLGSLQARPLVISPDGRWLHAGTNGGGVFELDLLDRRILPVVGSTPGANGTFFRTSVQLHNPGSESMAGRIVFHPSGASGSEADPALSYSLAPGQTQSIADLLPAMGRSGVGSADIEVTSGSVPIATARVFNDAGLSGTTGFTEVAMRAEEALQAGQTGVLLIPADLTVARFNLGVRTLEEGASVTYRLRNAAGSVLETSSRTLPPTYHEQQDAAGFLSFSEVPPGGSISITVTSGAAILYGATVDNRTGDPSLQIARATSP